MNIEAKVFERCTPDFEKLKRYGFKKSRNEYKYERLFFDNKFKACIKVLPDGNIIGKVYDEENGDEYLPLRIENNQGAYTAEVKSAYIDLLEELKDKCFDQQYFITPQANRICALVIKNLNEYPVFMWEKFSTDGVFKNSETGKWFGIIMYISRTKLAEPSEELVEVLNVKLDKNEIPELLKKEGYYPAYHMNKKYWISITLDDTLKDDEILGQIEKSYSFTKKLK